MRVIAKFYWIPSGTLDSRSPFFFLSCILLQRQIGWPVQTYHLLHGKARWSEKDNRTGRVIR